MPGNGASKQKNCNGKPRRTIELHVLGKMWKQVKTMTSTSRTDPAESAFPRAQLEKGVERYDALKLRRFVLIDLEAAEINLAPADFETGLRTLIAEAVISSHPDRLRQLWKSIIAAVSERYLWAPPRVAPRQVSTKPAADNVVRRCTRLLSMVHELHKAGYQRIRISPGLSPSGGPGGVPSLMHRTLLRMVSVF
jgi:hypothetical protein